MNLDPVVAEARAIVEKAATVYIHHTGRSFVGLILHGSALKGGFIAGCSDIDLQLYVLPDALDSRGQLPFELTVAVHRDLSRIDPAPFRYIQCYPFSTKMPAGWTAPVAGAYHVVAGRLPIPEATAYQLRESAVSTLATLDPVPSYLWDNLLEQGDGRLARLVRLICTNVWPTLFQLLIVGGADPIATWGLTKREAMERASSGTPSSIAIRAFYEALLRYYPAEDSVDAALDVLVRGVAFLRTAKADATATARNARP
jgi:hypothetical protein